MTGFIKIPFIFGRFLMASLWFGENDLVFGYLATFGQLQQVNTLAKANFTM